MANNQHAAHLRRALFLRAPGQPFSTLLAKPLACAGLAFIGVVYDFAQRKWGKTRAADVSLADLAMKWGLRDGCSFRDRGHIDAGDSGRDWIAIRHQRRRRPPTFCASM